MNATQTIRHYSDVHYMEPTPERRETDPANITEEPVDLLPASGLLIAVVLGAGLWALILTAGYFIFR